MSEQDLRRAATPPLSTKDPDGDLSISDQVQLEVDLLKSTAHDAKALNPAQRFSSRTGSHALTILVVDDDPNIRMYVKRCLAALEYEVEHILEAEDGVEALAWAQQGQIDLIICDVVMPRMNGFALCQALRRQEASRHIPVLLITGEMSEREAQGLVGDVQGVLSKPFNTRKLCDGVRQVLGLAPPP